MKVKILPDRCQGHGMCHLACSEVFSLDDIDGHGIVLTEHVPAVLEDIVMKAVESCPEQAIVVSD